MISTFCSFRTQYCTAVTTVYLTFLVCTVHNMEKTVHKIEHLLLSFCSIISLSDWPRSPGTSIDLTVLISSSIAFNSNSDSNFIHQESEATNRRWNQWWRFCWGQTNFLQLRPFTSRNKPYLMIFYIIKYSEKLWQYWHHCSQRITQHCTYFPQKNWKNQNLLEELLAYEHLPKLQKRA